MNPITGENYEETKFQSKLLANRMRSIFYFYVDGVGVGSVLTGQDSVTHYIDCNYKII